MGAPEKLDALLLEVTMKKLVLAAAFVGAASAGYAGTIEEPIIEAPVVIEEASGSSAGVVLPLVLLAVLVAAVGN
jgi:hypothetical protein